MASVEVMQAVIELLRAGLESDEGLIGMPVHEVIGNPSITGKDRFLSREAFAYLDKRGWGRRPIGSKIWFLTDDGRTEALKYRNAD